MVTHAQGKTLLKMVEGVEEPRRIVYYSGGGFIVRGNAHKVAAATVDAMERGGFIERNPEDEKDRAYYITERGKAAAILHKTTPVKGAAPTGHRLTAARKKVLENLAGPYPLATFSSTGDGHYYEIGPGFTLRRSPSYRANVSAKLADYFGKQGDGHDLVEAHPFLVAMKRPGFWRISNEGRKAIGLPEVDHLENDEALLLEWNRQRVMTTGADYVDGLEEARDALDSLGEDCPEAAGMVLWRENEDPPDGLDDDAREGLKVRALRKLIESGGLARVKAHTKGDNRIALDIPLNSVPALIAALQEVVKLEPITMEHAKPATRSRGW